MKFIDMPFGVRKYDDAAGRFLSIDPLWEKYLAWSPYHYCGNNPVNATDGNGKYPNYENLNDQEISIIISAFRLAPPFKTA